MAHASFHQEGNQVFKQRIQHGYIGAALRPIHPKPTYPGRGRVHRLRQQKTLERVATKHPDRRIVFQQHRQFVKSEPLIDKFRGAQQAL